MRVGLALARVIKVIQRYKQETGAEQLFNNILCSIHVRGYRIWTTYYT